MKKKDLEFELRCSELALASLGLECAKLYAALIERDIKIKTLIDAQPNANRGSAPPTEEE